METRTLKEQILADLKDAMKKQEADRLSAIRFLQAAVKNMEIELRPNPISDADIVAVVRKSVKQRQDSIEQFTAAGRQDLVDKESFELSVIQKYLPVQLSQEKIREVIVDVISEMKASTIKDMGPVMKVVQSRLAGQADSKTVAEMVKSQLQS